MKLYENNCILYLYDLFTIMAYLYTIDYVYNVLYLYNFHKNLRK